MRYRVAMTIALTVLTGCSAVGVVETRDPHTKLAQASELFDRSDRPVPAERLIREAIDIYAQRRDNIGLADAFSTYGFFFRSTSVEHWQHIYRSNGFLDKEVAFDTRLQGSVTYFDRAAKIYRAEQRFDRLANVEFNAGVTYALMHKDKEACAAYDASTLSRRRADEACSSCRPQLPAGFENWDAFIRDAKRRLGCAS